VSRADWCQYEGCFDNKVTPESRARGFGPGGVRTEKIRELVPEMLAGRDGLFLERCQSEIAVEALADMLISDVV
jgi:hypothetical protein